MNLRKEEIRNEQENREKYGTKEGVMKGARGIPEAQCCPTRKQKETRFSCIAAARAKGIDPR